MSDYERGDPTDAPPGAPLPLIGAVGTGMYAPPPPRRRRNWLLAAGGLVVFALVATVGVFIVLNMAPTAGLDTTRAGYEYLPDNSAMAFEMRLDLPAGQREEVASFLSRFPHFADAGEVEQRMDELINEAVATATGGRGSYDEDVEPWFAGWIVAGGGVPAMTMQPGGSGSFVAVIGSTDRDLAEQSMEVLRGGESWSSEAGPDGVTIWTGEAPFDGSGSTYAVTDDAVVLGMTVEDVRRAVERKTGEGANLLGVPRFHDAMARQPAGRLGAYWLDYQALSNALGSFRGAPFPSPLSCPGMAEPATMTGSVYMRDGRAYMDVGVEMTEGGELPQMRDSGLAESMPADTFFFLDVRDVGTSATRSLECLRDQPMFAEQLREIEERLGQPLDQLVSWAADAGVGVRYDGIRTSGGLVVKVTDETRAAEAMGQLRALLTAMGGESVSVREEEYGGARLVIFQADELTGPTEPPAPSASLAYAFVGDLLVIGVDHSFVRAVIETVPGNSLSAHPAFRRAVEAAGGVSNGGVAYVEFGTAMSLVDAVPVPNESLAELREIVGSLESLAAVSSVDGQTVVTRLVLSTREP